MSKESVNSENSSKLNEKVEENFKNIDIEVKDNDNDNDNDIKDVNKDLNSKEESKALIETGTIENSVAQIKDRKGNRFKNLKKSHIVGIIVILSILALIVLFSVIACINNLNDKVYKNVYLFGQNIGGMTKEQVSDILNNVNDQIKSKKISVYQDSNEILSVNSEEIDYSIDVSKTIKDTMGFGRVDGIFANNYKILKALIKPVDIEVSYIFDEEKIDSVIKNIDLTVKDRAVDDSYNVDEKNKKLIITRGKSGNSINYDEEKNRLKDIFEDKSNNKMVLNIITKKPEELNVDNVYREVKREAKDAYVNEDEKPIKFISEVIGIDFDVEALKKVLDDPNNKTEGKVIEFELKITEPKVKLQDLTSKYYNDKISGKTTYFPAGQYARSNNLAVALSYLNGRIVMPGEVFSYNAAIGDTTAAKGYQAAATFKGGTVVNEMGGGICQTTSTLYDAVLMANLEIIERHQHGLPVGYVSPSLDATVYSPVLDFKFKNTRNYPIKIVTSFSYAGNLNVSIYGTKEENEYDITLSSQVINTIPFTTKYIYDDNMNEGTQEIVTNGVDGYVSEDYMTRTQNGVFVDSKTLSRDTYNAQQQVVRVGTRYSAS